MDGYAIAMSTAIQHVKPIQTCIMCDDIPHCSQIKFRINNKEIHINYICKVSLIDLDLAQP